MVKKISKAKGKNKYDVKCPQCGSSRVWGVGYNPTSSGLKQRLRCLNCGKNFQTDTAAPVRKSRKKIGK